MEGDIITLQDIYKYDYKAMRLVADGRPPGVRRPARRPRHHPARRAVRRARHVAAMKRRLQSPRPARCWRSGRRRCSADRAHAQGRRTKLEVMLAIDTSGSMRHAIEAAKAAANEFVVAMPADVRIGLEAFGDDVTVLSPPTTDRAAAHRADQRDRRRRRHRAVRRRGRRQPAVHAGGRAQGARDAVRRQGRRQHRARWTQPSRPSRVSTSRPSA